MCVCLEVESEPGPTGLGGSSTTFENGYVSVAGDLTEKNNLTWDATHTYLYVGAHSLTTHEHSQTRAHTHIKVVLKHVHIHSYVHVRSQ